MVTIVIEGEDEEVVESAVQRSEYDWEVRSRLHPEAVVFI